MKINDYMRIGKNRAKTIFIAFIIFILIFTFFSKSFLAWTLPRVTVEKVDSGSLLKVMRSEGQVLRKSKFELYYDIPVRILELHTKKYDEVTKGDILMVLDTTPLEKQIKNLNAELSKLDLALNRVEISKNNALLGLKSESLDRLVRELNQSKENLDNQMIIYESGGISKNELLNWENSYNTAKENYEKQVEANLKNNELIKNEILGIEIQIKEYNLSIMTIKEDIISLEEDIESCIVKANEDGIVEALPYTEGMLINSSTPLYILSSDKDGYEVHSDFQNETSKFISIGDKFSVTIKELGEVVNGVVIEKRKSDYSGVVTLILDIEHDDLMGGEICDLFMRKQYGDYDVRIPRSAIYARTQIENVFVLIEQDTAFGKSYTVKFQEVLLGESDDVNIGIVNGLYGNEKIITSSSRDLSDGDKVIIDE
ncbi:MAG: hypothetical protein JEZ08_11865 [Clostridiales bacterium]|nr:hypothetical protein [Clostridiales bacterium]